MTFDMTPYAIIDTETDGLQPGYLPWEIAVFRWQPRINDWGSWLIHIEDYNPSLITDEVDQINGFRRRWRKQEENDHLVLRERTPAAIRVLANILRGQVIVGSNPGYDTQALLNLGVQPVWSHRKRDIPSVFLGRYGYDAGGIQACAEAMEIDQAAYPAHTALGDALLARDMFTQMMKEAHRG